MELALIRSLMDREFYEDHRGARCPNRLFSKDVRKIKEVIDNAMTRYDRTVTPDEIEALFMSNNPSMTTAQKGAYSSLFLKIKKEQKLGEDIAKEVLSKLFQQIIGEDIANLGFDYVNGAKSSLEPLRALLEQYGDDFTPSMDIQIASNFERLLYDVKDCNSDVTKDVMAEIKNNTYKIDKNDLDKIKKNFISEMLDENETVEMIKTINDEHQMVVDPHTAVGIGAVRKLGLEKNCVVLSTAHPCKFPKAIEDAISKTENLPDSLKYVNDRKEKFELLSNDIEKVKKYVMNSI